MNSANLIIIKRDFNLISFLNFLKFFFLIFNLNSALFFNGNIFFANIRDFNLFDRKKIFEKKLVKLKFSEIIST
jgi:hypothetical protein